MQAPLTYTHLTKTAVMVTSTLLKALGNKLSPAGDKGRLSILIYHRVLPNIDPIFPNETTCQRFDAEMRALKAVFNVLPLSDAVRKLKSGTLPPRAASITFDDGYADNVELAIPILERHGLVATFFIATNYLNGGRMFNDTIIEAIRHSPLDRLDLNRIGLDSYKIDTFENMTDTINKLLSKVKYLPLTERDDKVSEIAELAESQNGLPNNLMMTDDQVMSICSSGMEVGGHTDTHPILSKISDQTAQAEISKGKETLESLTGNPITLFAYPNGKPGIDYRPEQVSLIKKMGFKAAVSTQWGAASRHSDIYQLPRFTPWGNIRAFTPRLLRNLMQKEFV